MTAAEANAVVADTMVVSALINESQRPQPAKRYLEVIAGRRIIVSFSTVTEMRFGAIKAGWGELRRRALERDLSRFAVVQPDDQLMNLCAQLRATCERSGHGLGQKIHEADRWIWRWSRTTPVSGMSPVSRSSPRSNRRNGRPAPVVGAEWRWDASFLQCHPCLRPVVPCQRPCQNRTGGWNEIRDRAMPGP